MIRRGVFWVQEGVFVFCCFCGGTVHTLPDVVSLLI